MCINPSYVWGIYMYTDNPSTEGFTTVELLWNLNLDSILLEVSGRWYFCKDLSSLYPVRSITNFSGNPFCSPRGAVVARRLRFVNWPKIPVSLHINLLTVFLNSKCIKIVRQFSNFHCFFISMKVWACKWLVLCSLEQKELKRLHYWIMVKQGP